MSLLNTLDSMFLVLCLTTGCGKMPAVPTVADTQVPGSTAQSTPTGSTSTLNPAANPSPEPSASPEASPVPSAFPLSYYSVTKAVTPNTGGPARTYVATGNCVQYQSRTWCWDDGMKTISYTLNHTLDTFTYSFFNISQDMVGWAASNGGMKADLFSVPTEIDSAFLNNMEYSADTVNDVLNGTPTAVSCTDDAGVLDCGSFVISL